jgi:carbonic anhydrase
MCELNVIEQAANVCLTTVVQDAWSRGQELAVHGWVYSLSDGLVRVLRDATNNPDGAIESYARALDALR